jgi:ubiquitin-protein ligase
MAAAPNPLNKIIWRQLTDVKLLNTEKNLKNGKFFYENSLFVETDEALPKNCTQNIITGKLWLTSKIYQEYALRIELHLPSTYPMLPPEVIITTPIYHPNVNEKSE